jgi:hypothetical protein
VIISATGTIAGYFVIPLPPPQPEPSIGNTVDWVSGALITIGLITLLFVLSEANRMGLSRPWIPSLIVVSIIIILAFGFWQYYLETKTQKRPLMKMSIFKNRKFMWANVLMALSSHPSTTISYMLRTGSKTTKACRSFRLHFVSSRLV